MPAGVMTPATESGSISDDTGSIGLNPQAHDGAEESSGMIRAALSTILDNEIRVRQVEEDSYGYSCWFLLSRMRPHPCPGGTLGRVCESDPASL